MNVLSLFDGVSCGMVALERAGISVTNYYSSEIDKHAIKVSEDNHSNIFRIGDVTKVKYENGWLFYEDKARFVGVIDLLIGGSPCQSFSSAAAMTGNQNGLDGKSKLFYEYLRILKEIQSYNPNVKFFLENVRMKKESKEMLDDYLGVIGKYFNSELVSYQKRPRFYWCNWEWDLPCDKNISFQDYIQRDGVDYCKGNRTPSRERMWNNGSGRSNAAGVCANITYSDKIYCLTTKQDRSPNSGLIEYGDFFRYLSKNEMEQAQNLPIGYTDCISYNQAQAVLGNCWTVDAVAHIFESMK